MPKKKKISTFKRDRIRDIISKLDLKKDFEEFDMSEEYYEKYIYNNSDTKTFKNIGKFSFFPTIYNNTDALLIYSILAFPFDKKDSIEINKQVISVIDFIEKLFVEINDVRMLKYNGKDSKEHYVFLKMVVNGDLNNILSRI